MANFSINVPEVSISELGLKKIVNGAPTGDSLTSTTQISSSDAWGKIVENNGNYEYKLYFFFQATSLNSTGSTYEITGGTNVFGVNQNIKRIIERGSLTNIYAIEMSVRERYESSGDSPSDSYDCRVIIKTNDDGVQLEETIVINHDFCIQGG
jgi:hypothetical protein